MSIATIGSSASNDLESIYQDKSFVSSKTFQLIMSIVTMILGMLLLICSIFLLSSIASPVSITSAILMILSGIALGSIGIAIMFKKCVFFKEDLVEKNQFFQKLLKKEREHNQHLKISLDTFSTAYHDLAD